MKKALLSLVVITAILTASIAVFTASAAETVNFYVSPNGSDSAEGTLEAPFATVAKAQEAVRALSSYPAGGVVINLRAGTYRQTAPLSFTKEDSGKSGAPVIYQAYNNEEVTISGSTQLDSSKWTAVTDEKVKAKLPKEAADKVMQIDVSNIDLGMLKALKGSSDPFDDEGIWGEFVFNHKSAQMAKYPDTGKYLYTVTGGEGEFTFDDSIASKIADDKNLTTLGWYDNDYWAYNVPVKSLNGNTVTVKDYASFDYSGGTIKASRRFYFMNSAAFINVPGEYYLDFENKVLYYYPESDVKTGISEITTLKGNLINMTGTSYVVFKGINFDGGRRHAIMATECKYIYLDKCKVRNFGGHGVCFMDGSQYCKIANSEVAYIGSRGINLKGGDSSKLITSGFEVVNNDIHHMGRNYNFQPAGVYVNQGALGTPGVYIAHNYFHDMPSQAQNTTTNGITEYNEYENCSYEAADYAVIYTGGGLLGYGTQTRYNYFHDNLNYFHNDNGYGSNAYYIDGGNGHSFYGNVVVNQHRNMFYISSGTNNVCKGNIFVGNPTSDSYENWPDSTQSIRIAAYDTGLSADDYFARFGRDWLKDNAVWKEAFPQMYKDMESNIFANEPYVEITNNVMYNCGPMKIGDAALKAKDTKIENNFETTKDPGFVDAKNGNYQLKDDSEVYTKIPGFEKIDMSKIGLMNTDYDLGYSVPNGTTGVPSGSSLNKVSNAVVLQINSPKAMSNGADVYVDKDNMAVTPVIIDSRTLVPVRFISEAFGAKVGWNGDTRQVAVVYGDKTVIMQIDSQTFTVNGETKTMDVPPMILEGRTVIPIRALTESLGKKVFWDPQGLIVISDTADTLDSAADAALITELLNKTK